MVPTLPWYHPATPRVQPASPGSSQPALDPAILASPAGQDPDNPGHFCQKCRLAPPDSQLFRKSAGKAGFPHVPGSGHPGIVTARAELKSSLLTTSEVVKTRIPGAIHSI